MSTFPKLDWLEAFRDRVNGDPEMKLIGNWFTTSISLSFGDVRYVLHIDKGRIDDIVAQPRIDAEVRVSKHPQWMGWRGPWCRKTFGGSSKAMD